MAHDIGEARVEIRPDSIAPIPTVVVDRIDTTREVWLNIDDGPVLTKQYGLRKFRVDKVSIIYRHSSKTGTWKWANFYLYGPYVKNDGTDSTHLNRDGFYTMKDVVARGFWSLVEQHMPGAAL